MFSELFRRGVHGIFGTEYLTRFRGPRGLIINGNFPEIFQEG